MRKLIRGGDGLAEAIANVDNAGIGVVPFRAKCEYVISDAAHMSAGLKETEDERTETGGWRIISA